MNSQEQPAKDSTEQSEDKFTIWDKEVSLADIQKDPEMIKGLVKGNMLQSDYTKKSQKREEEYKAKLEEIAKSQNPPEKKEELSDELKAANDLIDQRLKDQWYMKKEEFEKIESGKQSVKKLDDYLSKNEHINGDILKSLVQTNPDKSYEQIAEEFQLHSSHKASKSGKNIPSTPYDLREKKEKINAFELPKILR